MTVLLLRKGRGGKEKRKGRNKEKRRGPGTPYGKLLAMPLLLLVIRKCGWV